MNPEFSVVTHNGVELLVYTPWWQTGVMHGMTTRQLSFDSGSALASAGTLCNAVAAERLILLTQVHGNAALDLRNDAVCSRALEGESRVARQGEFDAIVLPSQQGGSPCVYAVGVLSADCVPVIVRGAKSIALIHAGWRGLANGVIEKSLGMVGEPQEAVVMACAGGRRYEVGREVVDAIGPAAAFKEASRTLYLDTAATAINQLRAAEPAIHVVSSGICSIADLRFHSHRRDAAHAGRCLTFFVPPLAP
jgi:copper oxidase (laccase) domain-containing protein